MPNCDEESGRYTGEYSSNAFLQTISNKGAWQEQAKLQNKLDVDTTPPVNAFRR